MSIMSDPSKITDGISSAGELLGQIRPGDDAAEHDRVIAKIAGYTAFASEGYITFRAHLGQVEDGWDEDPSTYDEDAHQDLIAVREMWDLFIIAIVRLYGMMDLFGVQVEMPGRETVEDVHSNLVKAALMDANLHRIADNMADEAIGQYRRGECA